MNTSNMQTNIQKTWITSSKLRNIEETKTKTQKGRKRENDKNGKYEITRFKLESDKT